MPEAPLIKSVRSAINDSVERNLIKPISNPKFAPIFGLSVGATFLLVGYASKLLKRKKDV